MRYFLFRYGWISVMSFAVTFALTNLVLYSNNGRKYDMWMGETHPHGQTITFRFWRWEGTATWYDEERRTWYGAPATVDPRLILLLEVEMDPKAER